MHDEVIYGPESQLRSPARLVRAMWHDLLASRELAWRLTVRDISARYRQSLLGIVWAFFPPIATALIFVVLNREGAINVAVPDVPYPAFVLVGTVLWQLFTDSLNAPLRMVMSNKSMIAKINLPRESLILSAMAQVLFDFLIKAVILVFVFFWFGLPLSWGLLSVPLAVLMLMVLGITIGLLLTPFGILYSDISTNLPMITSLWFFVTPVVYPCPERWPLSKVIGLNPVTPLLVAARDLITVGSISNIWGFAMVSCLSLAGLLVMWILYRVSLPILIERVTS